MAIEILQFVSRRQDQQFVASRGDGLQVCVQLLHDFRAIGEQQLHEWVLLSERHSYSAGDVLMTRWREPTRFDEIDVTPRKVGDGNRV